MRGSTEPRRLRLLAVGAALVALAGALAVTAAADGKEPGFLTGKPAMLTGVAPGVKVTPLITVGETLPSGYRFESIPDGIALTRQQGEHDEEHDEEHEGNRKGTSS